MRQVHHFLHSMCAEAHNIELLRRFAVNSSKVYSTFFLSSIFVFNLKSTFLQMTFIVIFVSAVFMLYTWKAQSKIKQTPNIELNKPHLTSQSPPSTSIISEHKRITANGHIDQTSLPLNNTHARTNLPKEHISSLNQTLDNNLSLEGVHATIREDGTVILHSQGKLQTISVARIDERGNLVFEEYNQSISSDIYKDN